MAHGPGVILPEPARILVAGDWHGSGQWGQKVIHYARRQGCDVIVHCGDYGWWLPSWDGEKYLRHLQRNLEECGITLYWVDGNHENHDSIQEWVDATDGQPWSDARYPNIVHLPRGFRWIWWGYTWLAMGGAHSVDRLHRTEGKDWWDGEHITEAEIERAIKGGKVHVMVSHDCPYGVPIPGIHAAEKLDAEKSPWPLSEIQASNEHRKKLRRVVDAVRPALVLHGHFHVRYEGVLNFEDGTRAIIQGLAEDHTSLEENTLLINRSTAPVAGICLP